MVERIQLSRRKGWRMPPNTVKVTRPGPYGNPFRVERRKPGVEIWCVRRDEEILDSSFKQKDCVLAAVGAFKADAMLRKLLDRPSFDAWINPLRGKNLACWCRLGDPCHADVLLELANSPRCTDVAQAGEDAR